MPPNKFTVTVLESKVLEINNFQLAVKDYLYSLIDIGYEIIFIVHYTGDSSYQTQVKISKTRLCGWFHWMDIKDDITRLCYMIDEKLVEVTTKDWSLRVSDSGRDILPEIPDKLSIDVISLYFNN